LADTHTDQAAAPTRSRPTRSALWTALLIPFFILPHRWLWFPCGLGAMLLAWPTKSRLSDLIRRDGTLIVGSAGVLIVRTGLDPMRWLPWIGASLLVCWLRSQSWWSRGLGIAAVGMVWVASVCLLLRPSWPGWLGANGHIDPAAILVCAGDSLTSGVDPHSDADRYVARLRERLGCRVINAGVAGDRTADLLARLGADVLSHHPTAVLVFIGGNDYLGGTPRREFADHFEALISRIATTGAKPVIVEVPSGLIWNPYAGIYRRTAQRHGAVLVPDSRLRWWYTRELLARRWLNDPLTTDGIHLSPTGATRVADWLAPYVRGALTTTPAP